MARAPAYSGDQSFTYGVIALLCIAAIIAFVVLLGDGIGIQFFLLAMILLFGGVGLTTTLRGFDLFEPIWPVLGMVFFSYFLRAYGLWQGGLSSFSRESASFANAAFFEQTLALVLASLVAFVIGYFLVQPTLPPRKVAQPATESASFNRRLGGAALVLLAVSGGSVLILLNYLGGPRGLLEAAGDRLEAFSGLGYLVLLVVAGAASVSTWILLSHYWKWSQYRGLRIVCFLASGLLVLAMGSRARLTTMLLMVTWGWFYFRRPSLRGLRWIAGAVLLLFVLSALAQYRAKPEEGFGAALTERVSQYSEQGPARFVIGQASATPEFDVLTSLVGGVPSKLDYQKGQTYLALFTAFIPKSIFPSKLEGASTITNENFFSERYAGGTGSGVRTGGIVGELWLNFGYAGTIFGMLLFGVAIRMAYVRLQDRLQHPLAGPRSAYHLILYVVSWAHLPQLVRGEFLGTAISITVFSFFACFTYLLARIRLKPV